MLWVPDKYWVGMVVSDLEGVNCHFSNYDSTKQGENNFSLPVFLLNSGWCHLDHLNTTYLLWFCRGWSLNLSFGLPCTLRICYYSWLGFCYRCWRNGLVICYTASFAPFYSANVGIPTPSVPISGPFIVVSWIRPPMLDSISSLNGYEKEGGSDVREWIGLSCTNSIPHFSNFFFIPVQMHVKCLGIVVKSL